MDFGEMNAKNLAKSLLNMHRKDSQFDVRFATIDQARMVGAELTELCCKISIDEHINTIRVERPPKIA
jgi:hypothetical protein